PNQASFATMPNPLQVSITPAQFTAGTTLEVLLNVEQDISGTDINAGFDRIQLTDGNLFDLIFANGFDS
ncbi:MAG: hypothetical protein WAV67_14840, partial [Dokdonella sp.]